VRARRSVHASAKIALAAKRSDAPPPVLVFGELRSLPALDDEYRFVVNGIGFTDLL
jgi:hypothetical protein